MPRPCACGCGREFEPYHAKDKYATTKCGVDARNSAAKMRRYRERLARRARCLCGCRKPVPLTRRKFASLQCEHRHNVRRARDRAAGVYMDPVDDIYTPIEVATPVVLMDELCPQCRARLVHDKDGDWCSECNYDKGEAV